ncbi:hypothetical protein BJV74DRAFT_210128 [Russula compacta]|nr:hypothetical protein BJV74DRAFT_210128 [Russula compacta]
MSARQPFLPSRPASRTVNPSEQTTAAPSNVPHAVSNNTSSNIEFAGPARPLNISSFKKSAPRTTNSSVKALLDPDTTIHNNDRNQNQAHSGGMTMPARSSVAGKSSTTTTRIYAPRPFTPPAPGAISPVEFSFAAPEFKTPSLPLPFATKNADDAAGQQQCSSVEIGAPRPSVAANSDAVAPGQFQVRPMSCRPQDEIDAQARRPPSTHQRSFFGLGGAQFSFDSVSSNLDDSGYYSSSVSEQNEIEGDQLAATNRGDAARLSATGNEVMQAARNVNMRAGVNPNFDANFANPTKRIRPTSLGDGEDIVMDARLRELSKRPCVDRGSLRPHASLPGDAALGNISPGETQTFGLPPNIPHPMATLGDFPGLEFSEADLGRYAELYEKGAERWSRSTMEEWLAGANDIMTKFTELMDMVSLSSARAWACLRGVFRSLFPFPFHRSRST